MRTVILGLLVSILALAPAFAAQGYKGRISTTISLSDSFFKAADPHGRSPMHAGGFTIPPVTGVLYVSGTKMRMDMNAPMGTLTTLFDGQTGYMLDQQKQIAWLLPKPQSNAGDLPLFNLDAVASNWGAMNQRLGSMAGVTSKKLGKKTINGQKCQGVKFSGDIHKLLDADEIQVVPGMPSLSNLKGNWSGTFWVSEKLGLPVKINSSFSGVNLTWQVSDLKSADIPDALLKLPPGYKVKQMDTPQVPTGTS